jgi:hypothetical protein
METGLIWRVYQEDGGMEQEVIMDLDAVSVRFTADGKISVIDAIKAVSSSEHPWIVWESLKAEHPEILNYCEDYTFHMQGPVPVANSEGWDKICAVLPEYLPDLCSP